MMVLPLLTFTNALQPSPSAGASEAALGQHMKVQVLHALAAVLTHIGDNAVAALIHTQLAAKLRNHGIDMAQQAASSSVSAAADAMWRFGMTRK
mgnify:CR=1 FL=1